MIRLFVRDNDTNVVHEVGTNSHDSLILVNGAIEYYNLQNGCGTRDDETYSFCNQDGTDIQALNEEYDITKYILIGKENFTKIDIDTQKGNEDYGY